MENNLSVFHEHYRDTCEINRAREKTRERYLVYTMLSLGFLFFLKELPSELIATVSLVDADKANALASVPTDVLEALTWFVLFIFCHKHLQISTQIDRLYSYIHELEEYISDKWNTGEVFQREGAAYVKKYPAFSWWTFFLYVYLLPGTTWVLATFLALPHFSLAYKLSWVSVWITGVYIALSISIFTRSGFVFKNN